MPMINPLDLPEIVMRVGKFIPLWVMLRGHKYIFCPKDLLSCCLVSRSWREIMLPILWYTYDETTNKNYSRIPPCILFQYAPLFKIISTVHPNSSHAAYIDMFQAKVKQLSMTSDRFAYSFNLNNPYLHLMDIQAETNVDDNNYIPTDPVPMISSFPTLLHLRLRRYVFLGTQIERLLFGKKDLEILELHHTSIRGPIHLSLQHRALTHLHLQYCHIDERSLIGLFHGMPSLHSLSWLLSKANVLAFNSARMRDVLETFCPKLRHIHLGMHYKSQTTRHLLNLLPHGEKVSLEYISLNLNTLQPEALRGLDDRSARLLQVSVSLARKVNKFAEMGIAFSNLRRLRVFSLTCKHDRMAFDAFLQNSINNAPDVTWITTGTKDNLRRTLDPQTPPLMGRWISSPSKGDCEQDAPLFDVWILSNILSSSHIQEVIINGRAYVVQHRAP